MANVTRLELADIVARNANEYDVVQGILEFYEVRNGQPFHMIHLYELRKLTGANLQLDVSGDEWKLEWPNHAIPYGPDYSFKLSVSHMPGVINIDTIKSLNKYLIDKLKERQQKRSKINQETFACLLDTMNKFIDAKDELTSLLNDSLDDDLKLNIYARVGE